MKKILFVCSTPFQVLSSLFLVNSLDDKAYKHLMIINQFPYEKIARNIKHEKLFDKISALDERKIFRKDSKSMLVVRLSQIVTYIDCRKIVKKLLPDIEGYTDIFVSSRSPVNRLICMYAAEYVRECKIHYFDDGIGSYTNTIVDIKKIDKVLRSVLVGRRAANYSYDRYLYSPLLYKQLHSNDNTDIHMIQINADQEQIKRIFTFNDSNSINEPVLIFDVVMSRTFFPEGETLYKNAINLILNKKQCMIKPHPREKNKIFDGKYIENTTMPFEVMCYSQNFSEKALVSNFSTAVFMPKILFNQEPKIILLYKLMEMYRRDNSLFDDEIVRDFIKLYKDKNKIFIPTNIEELDYIIENY